MGDFVMSVFVPGSMQALTATTDGDLVVWDEQGITAQMGTRATDRRAVKLMRIHSGVSPRTPAVRAGACWCMTAGGCACLRRHPMQCGLLLPVVTFIQKVWRAVILHVLQYSM